MRLTLQARAVFQVDLMPESGGLGGGFTILLDRILSCTRLPPRLTILLEKAVRHDNFLA